MCYANLSGTDLNGATFSSETNFDSAELESATNVDKMILVSRNQYLPHFVENDDSQIGASGFAAQLAAAVAGGIMDKVIKTAESTEGEVESPTDDDGEAESPTDDDPDDLMNLLEGGKLQIKKEVMEALQNVVEGLSDRGMKALAENLYLGMNKYTSTTSPFPPRSK